MPIQQRPQTGCKVLVIAAISSLDSGPFVISFHGDCRGVCEELSICDCQIASGSAIKHSGRGTSASRNCPFAVPKLPMAQPERAYRTFWVEFSAMIRK
jgi:hypothetical protein